jgi:hypothetical protein
MMIIKVKYQPMSNFVFFVHIYIKAYNPNIENKDSYASPCWKISSKFTISV